LWRLRSASKTALGTNIAINAAHHGKLPVGFFSLEMSASQLAIRVLSERVEIPSHKLRRGDVDIDQFKRVVAEAENLSTLPIYTDQLGGISIAQLVARARRMKRKHGIGLIVVDYLQLMQASKRRESRVQDITEITTGLKALAKELRVPVLALSQLSRETERRDNKRPQLSDLRESGSIEQDADVVLFVYRDEYYLERAAPSEDEPQKLPPLVVPLQTPSSAGGYWLRNDGARALPVSKWNFGCWQLGPPPGSPKCIVPAKLIDELRLTDLYTDKGIRRK
jgi:replicative DNA helicase